MRTDAYGAVRAGAGLQITSYKINHNAALRDAVGENAAGIAALTTAEKLTSSFNPVAMTHQTVGLAAHLGSNRSDASSLDDEAAPMKALLKVASGKVGTDSLGVARSDASAKNSSDGEGMAPHLTDPIIAIVGQAGFDAVAGQSVQLANGESAVLVCGQDMQCVGGGKTRMHNGQVIGMLAGAVKAGQDDVGLQMISAKDSIEIQAQADSLKVQACDVVSVMSASAHVDWAAAKSVMLSTAGGANIVIAEGKITFQCPGKIKVHAGKKRFLPGQKQQYTFPQLPNSICVECLLKAQRVGAPFILRS
jgi:uncharacterized protein (DUF2345 family)